MRSAYASLQCSRNGGPFLMLPLAAMVGIGAASSMFGAASARSTNRREMEFAERMSSTAWQRGVADMRKAGLNPMLAFSQGPASSPTVGLDNPAEAADISGNMQSAIATVNQTKLVNAQVDALAGQAASSRADAAATGAQALRDAEAWEGSGKALSGQRALDMWDKQMANLEAQAASAGARADLDRVDKELKEMAKSGAAWSAGQFEALMDSIEALPDFMQGPVRMLIFILGQTGVIPGATYMMGKGMGKSSARVPEVPPSHMGGGPSSPAYKYNKQGKPIAQ